MTRLPRPQKLLSLVRRLPDIGEAHRRMKPVKQHERNRGVFDVNQSGWTIETSTLEELSSSFPLEGVHDPEGDVDDDQERDDFASGLLIPKHRGIAAATQTVDDQRCLRHHLHHEKHLR